MTHSAVHEQLPPAAQAAESGADEVLAAPTTETPLADHSEEDTAADSSEDWWADSDGAPTS